MTIDEARNLKLPAEAYHMARDANGYTHHLCCQIIGFTKKRVMIRYPDGSKNVVSVDRLIHGPWKRYKS
jgi:hypothetical protein